MNNDNIEIEKFKSLFLEDKIYNALTKYGYKEEVLFPEFIKTLNVKRLYTSLEVSTMLNMNDSSLRYYVTNLCKFEYLENVREGRNYKFNYISIYKLYLVQQFLKRQGKNLNNVKLLLHESVDSYQKEIKLIKNAIKRLDQYIGFLFKLEKGNMQTNEEVQVLNKKIRIIEKVILSWNENEEEIFKIEQSLYVLHKKAFGLNDEMNICLRKLLYLESDFNILLLKNDYCSKMYGLKDFIKQTKKGIFKRLFNNSPLDVRVSECTSNLSKQIQDLKNEMIVEQERKSNLEKEIFLVYKEIERETTKKMKFIERNREFINTFISNLKSI
ncbi:hypothetical protein CNQ87_13225 [Lysinibacillus fusiformis]|uniref:MerR family transcriptional regulator n=1 Tax=Lysinibacillus fusiformis TaxID=28031 RepID=UPI000BBA70F7|nr:MerR family transcriptional regulator [Lysinibacillus fusiformis]PCD81610.1 hypothetical protein CNQ87_13225 [Lysinibacillus fusiformis]